MSKKNDANTEAAIEAELAAIQEERAACDRGMRQKLAEIRNAGERHERELRTIYTDALHAIDLKHRNAKRRLEVAQAERIKAEAVALRSPPARTEVAAPVAKTNA